MGLGQGVAQAGQAVAAGLLDQEHLDPFAQAFHQGAERRL